MDNFYGNSPGCDRQCIEMISTGNEIKDLTVESLVSQIVERFGMAKNVFFIGLCSSIEKAQATLDNNRRPYILYNPAFLKEVRTMRFTNDASKGLSSESWETLAIFALEIAHHWNYHLINSGPNATFHEMELVADETAAFILYRLGASLTESQRVMCGSLVSETGSSTNPARSMRFGSNK